MMTVTIKPEEYYTLADIVYAEMFGFCGKSFWAHRNLIALDRRNKNYLQAIITGSGRASRYKFKGKNIINFIKQVDAGKVKLDTKPWQK